MEIISVPSPVPASFVNAAIEREVQLVSIDSVSFAGSKVSKPNAFATAMLPTSALFAAMALFKTSPEAAAVVVVAAIVLTVKAARSTKHVVTVVSVAMSKSEAEEEEEQELAIPSVPKRFIEGEMVCLRGIDVHNASAMNNPRSAANTSIAFTS